MALRPTRRPSRLLRTSFGGSSSRQLLPIVGWLALIAVAAVVPYTIAQGTSGGSTHLTEPAPVVATSPTPPATASGASPSAVVASSSPAPASTATAPATRSPAAHPAAAPAAAAASNTQAIPATPKPAPTTYVVEPGDSLWDIVTRSAAPTATVESIAASVQRTYAANRDVVGPDPNILHPGEVLELQP